MNRAARNENRKTTQHVGRSLPKIMLTRRRSPSARRPRHAPARTASQQPARHAQRPEEARRSARPMLPASCAEAGRVGGVEAGATCRHVRPPATRRQRRARARRNAYHGRQYKASSEAKREEQQERRFRKKRRGSPPEQAPPARCRQHGPQARTAVFRQRIPVSATPTAPRASLAGLFTHCNREKRR